MARRKPNTGKKPVKSIPPNGGNNIHDDDHETPTGGDSKVTKQIVKMTRPCVETQSSQANDPAWYKNLTAYFDDVSNWSFNNVAGLPFSATTGVEVNHPASASTTDKLPVLNGINNYTAEGIMVFDIAPTPGTLTSIHDAGNVAAQQLYTTLRKANSGRVNYDLPEPMMYSMGVDSAYMVYEYMLRGYRSMLSFNYANRYIPAALVEAQGFGMALMDELADFKAALDLFSYKLASLSMPDQFDIIKRHSWMFTNVYTDSAGRKAQMYLFNLHGVYIWTEGSNNKETYLKYTPLHVLTGNSLITSVKQVNAIMNAVLDPLLGSQDVGIISGDMRKAFGDANMITIAPVESHPFLEPVYEKEVLQQIENMEIVPSSRDLWAERLEASHFLDITQNLQNLTYGPYLTQAPSFPTSTSWNFQVGRKHVINMHSDQPTSDDVIVATRLIPKIQSLSYAGPNANVWTLANYGTEICVGARMIMINDIQANTYSINGFQSDIEINASQALMIATRWTKYDWAPTLYWWNRTSNAATLSTICCDLDNYYWADWSSLENLNNAAVMSEWKLKSYN